MQRTRFNARATVRPHPRSCDLVRRDGMTLTEFFEHTRHYPSEDVWRVTARILERGAPRGRQEFAIFYAAVCDELKRERGARSPSRVA